MSQSEAISAKTLGQDELGMGPAPRVRCPLPIELQRIDALTADGCGVLGEAGCPTGLPVEDRSHFESLLAELSATFINLPASQVDSQIESALRRIVEFLEADRGGLAEVLVEQKQIVITHSYHLPGVPPQPRTIVDEQLPWYATTIRRGEVLRLSKLPDDLPQAAIHEREYRIQVA